MKYWNISYTFHRLLLVKLQKNYMVFIIFIMQTSRLSASVCRIHNMAFKLGCLLTIEEYLFMFGGKWLLMLLSLPFAFPSSAGDELLMILDCLLSAAYLSMLTTYENITLLLETVVFVAPAASVYPKQYFPFLSPCAEKPGLKLIQFFAQI